jgi:hypothetical protein
MKHLVESLSIGTGAILVALVSVGVVYLLCAIFPRPLHSLWVIIVPFVFAYSLYWLPVWLGADSSEYSAWAFLCVGGWFLAGFFPSALLVLVLRRRQAPAK